MSPPLFSVGLDAGQLSSGSNGTGDDKAARTRAMADAPDTKKETGEWDLKCPDCGRNMGHSQGAKGLLAMHRKWSHPIELTNRDFLELFLRKKR